MACANSRLGPEMRAKNSFWYQSKTLVSDFPPTKVTRYSTLSLPQSNTAPVWGFASAERLLRPTVAGYGLPTTILAGQVFISHWLFLQTLEAWPPRAIDGSGMALHWAAQLCLVLVVNSRRDFTVRYDCEIIPLNLKDD